VCGVCDVCGMCVRYVLCVMCVHMVSGCVVYGEYVCAGLVPFV